MAEHDTHAVDNFTLYVNGGDLKGQGEGREWDGGDLCERNRNGGILSITM